MIITQPGKITDRITLLGRFESCLYLVEDQGQSVVLGGGMAHIVPELLEQLAKFRIDERRISHIVILHAHFDHCGAVPILKKRWPWARVVASRRAGELLAKPEVMESIALMNQAAVESVGSIPADEQDELRFESLEIEESVGEGDKLLCGGLDLEVIEVPGHSSCSIAIYMPAGKALFASDALGLFLEGVHHPTPNSNFDHYQQSLEKMARYLPEVILLEHFGAVSGEDARAYIPKAIVAAEETRELLESAYRRTRNIEQCTREITSLFLRRSADAFLPEAVRATVAGQMVRFIAKSVEEKMKDESVPAG